MQVYLSQDVVLDYLGEGPAMQNELQRKSTDFKRLGRKLHNKHTADALKNENLKKGLTVKEKTVKEDSL